MERDILSQIKEWFDLAFKSSHKTKVFVDYNGDFDDKLIVSLSKKIIEYPVTAVIVPCYSSPEHLLEQISYLKEQNIDYKMFGMKSIFDTIVDNDDVDNDIKKKIIEKLRDGVMIALSIKENAIILKMDHIEKDIFTLKVMYDDTYEYFIQDSGSNYLHKNDEIKKLEESL